MKNFVIRLLKDETGSETAELGVGLSVIAVGSVTAFRGLQDKLGDGLATITDSIDRATVPETPGDTPG